MAGHEARTGKKMNANNCALNEYVKEKKHLGGASIN
jgi:hypothetical protein